MIIRYLDPWGFRDNVTRYKTESVHFVGLMNSATK